MYFKQLELTGFKSFADRTALRFDPGVTAIVGPNGCGKSNLFDALRWCLGEQNARELRGTHMQDVVFNGSEERHPVGMAEVSVTFDNADSRLPIDYAEVEVMRRLYRSGESEYFINKLPCRLRDIHELFMDTGIGTEAYSLIGQGKMDLILSSKPEERRFIFEEAAGIIKYKTRKRIATRKLELAEQNLLRLSDIIAEVQRQMRSLKRQVNAAIRYRGIVARLRELAIRAAWLKYTSVSRELGHLRNQFAAAQDGYERISTELAQGEARFEELGLAKLEGERLLLARRESAHQIETELEKIERQIALVQQQMEFCRQQRTQALEELEGFQGRAAAIEERVRQSEQRLGELREQINRYQAALDAKQGEHAQAIQQLAEAEASVEALRASSLDRMSQQAWIRTEVETLGVRIANLQAQLQAMAEHVGAETHRHETLLHCLEETRKREANGREVLGQAETESEATRAKLTSHSQELRAVEGELQARREKKSSLEARLNSLRELRDTYEGFSEGVRAIMQTTQRVPAELTGILGPAGDLLTMEKTYERAIEAALGGNINNVIVETAETAQAAIEFLKKNRAGRVTFLPLDLIRGPEEDERRAVSAQAGVVGRALDFVQYDPRIAPAVQHLLRNTMLVETMDDAIRLTRDAREAGRSLRLVTLEGEVISPAGAVTGGRTRHEGRGLLGRRAEIEELERVGGAVEAEIEALGQKRVELAATVESLSDDMSRLEVQVAQARHTLNEAGAELARHSAEFAVQSETIEELARKRQVLQAQCSELEAQHREAQVRAEDAAVGDQAAQAETAAAQEAATRARQALAVCTDESAELRVQLTRLTQQCEEAQRNAQRERSEHEEMQREALRRKELGEQLDQKHSDLERAMAEHVEQSRALLEDKEAARKKVVAAENERQALLDAIEALDQALRTLREKARDAQAEMHRIEMVLRHDEDRLGFLRERIEAEFHVSLDSLASEQVGTDELDEAAREEIVEELRAQLQRMGEVNVSAIEEHEALDKRNTFLVAQAEDLHKARETLLGVITRNDQKIREMFMETFQKISENFRVYFRQLFNGGQARLYLLDESDPLESGIEIEARPPGKKPQTLSLLSGGESALTAIALLFSILKAKPSPFCVLDEVDAPLDDANIGRFLALLEEFSAESQFVVITHNKQTMAFADALYGVTMQERGVSQLVSVRFAEARGAETAA